MPHPISTSPESAVLLAGGASESLLPDKKSKEEEILPVIEIKKESLLSYQELFSNSANRTGISSKDSQGKGALGGSGRSPDCHCL